MGVYPESFLAPMRNDVATLLARIERARPAGDSQPTPGNPIAAAKAAEPKKAEHADDAQGAAH
jgi:NADH-quinone oxidoreductase subunit M